MKIIGVTGGVGAGKSSILQYIARHYKAKIFYADQVAMELELRGGRCYESLVELMGKEILLEDTLEIDRRAVADMVFGNAALLEKVNAIVHPAVKEYLYEQFEIARMDGTELVFVEAALLIECGYKNVVDEMWVVYADASVREKRLAQDRGYSAEKTHNIMKNQMSDEAFLKEADVVIDNSFDLQNSISQIREKLEAFTWHK